MAVFRNVVLQSSLLLIVLSPVSFSAKAKTREAKQNKGKQMYYEFPKDTIQCRQGDYIIRENDNRSWRVFFVEDIFFFSRLIPFDKGGAVVLAEQIDFTDSAPPPRWREIHLLVSEFEKEYQSSQDAVESIKSGRLANSIRGLCRGINEFPLVKSKVYRKPL